MFAKLARPASHRGRNLGSNSGLAIVVAAIILGFSILGGSFLLKGSIDRGTSALASLETAIEKSGARAAPTQQAARPGRPDPNRRYKIDIAGAPSIGSKKAKVTIVEWSDFQ
jgi:protein-disulfide isomerase